MDVYNFSMDKNIVLNSPYVITIIKWWMTILGIAISFLFWIIVCIERTNSKNNQILLI